ncbi:MAG: hypothetical protein M1142_04230 [Patescibacteria group bacterium]|nr:hypothetical protein [Patescibacteria group bacterium]
MIENTPGGYSPQELERLFRHLKTDFQNGHRSDFVGITPPDISSPDPLSMTECLEILQTMENYRQKIEEVINPSRPWRASWTKEGNWVYDHALSVALPVETDRGKILKVIYQKDIYGYTGKLLGWVWDTTDIYPGGFFQIEHNQYSFTTYEDLQQTHLVLPDQIQTNPETPKAIQTLWQRLDFFLQED